MSPRKRTAKLPHNIHPDALPKAHGVTITYLPAGKGRWAIRYWEAGKRKSHKLGNGSMLLHEIHAGFHDFMTNGAIDTLEALSLEFFKTSEYLDLAPRTKSDYRDCHNAIIKMRTRAGMYFGKAKLSTIKTATIRTYKETRAKVSPTRAAHEIRYLKRLFSWAIEYEYAKDNPAKAIRIKGLTKPRDHYVQDHDYLALLNIAPLNIAVAAHLSYLTGRRRTDVLELTRSQLAETGIQFLENKTGKATEVGWSDELRELVKLAGREFYLFPGSPGTRYSDRAFSSAWKRAMVKLEQNGFTKFQFKDLRAKHATDLELSGGDATDNLAHGRRGTTTKHYIMRRKVVPLR